MDETWIYLLDLNYTLIANSEVKAKPFTRQIDGEFYRMDLVEALKGKVVYLLTARPAMHEQRTIERIHKLTGWKPDAHFFNKFGLPPHMAKERMLQVICQMWNVDHPSRIPAQLFGIESNPKTRRMYEGYGIESRPYDELLNEDTGRLDIPGC